MMIQEKRQISAAAVPPLLVEWLKDDGLPFDITVCAGRRRQGVRQLVFTITGTNMEEVTAKTDALERAMAKLKA